MWSVPEALRSQLYQVASFPRCCSWSRHETHPHSQRSSSGFEPRTLRTKSAHSTLSATEPHILLCLKFQVIWIPSLIALIKYLILIRITFAVYFSQFPSQKNGQLSLSNWALVWSRAIAEQDLLEAQSGLDINVELNLSGLTSSD